MKDNNISSNTGTYVIVVLLIVLCCFVVLFLFQSDEVVDGFEPTPLDLLLHDEDLQKELFLPRKEMNKKYGDYKQAQKSAKVNKNQIEEVKKSIAMAMDVVKPLMKKISKTHRDIIKNQKRAPDSRYNINVTNSDIQSLDRDVPDTRPPVCKTFRYDLSQLPKATVIIPFYNEALSMLLRTIHSVLNRSPDSLLEEIILVDDCSPDKHLQIPLASYVQLLPKVKLIRNEERKGLIVSRMRGANMAQSPVLIFLDAHSEVSHVWLEPLLNELKINSKQVLQPFVNAIDAMTLKIDDPGEYHKGSFSWDLRYTWIKVTHHEQMASYHTGLPFFTPTLVGCAIAVDKKYFDEIGNFDDGLKVWGGENIELGFRTWMCGGKVTTVTCSHVGHVFKEFPYTFDGDKEEIVQKNLIRVAETWMDGMRKYFYASTRAFDFKRAELNKTEQVSLDERKKLRTKLGCQNFEWYMYNIMPQLNEPPMDAVFHGEIVNQQSRGCWEVTEDYFVTLTHVCYFHKIIPNNYFSLTRDGLLRYRDKCVKINPPSPVLIIDECPRSGNREAIEKFGVWKLETSESISVGWISVSTLNNDNTIDTWCIEQVTNSMPIHKGDQMPQLNICNKQNSFQNWAFTYVFDYSLVPKHVL